SRGGAGYACRRYRLPMDAGMLRARRAAVYGELIEGGVPSVAGARACLEGLHGGWKLAVVTNSTRAEATIIIEPLGFLPLFDALVAREDYASAKPAPDAYLAAAAALGIPAPACVAVEDTPRGLVAARPAERHVVA